MEKLPLLLAGALAAGVAIYAVVSKREPTEYTFKLKEGSNYISLPMIPDDATPDAVLGVEVQVKGYDPATGWHVPSFLECGEGYLVGCAGPKTITITGTKCVITLSDLIYTYNTLTGIPYEGYIHALIGPGTKTINISGSILEGHIIKYIQETGEWEPTNILEPKKAYWMKKPI